MTVDKLINKQHHDFSAELETRNMKVWVVVFIQNCNINPLSEKSFLVKEVHIFCYIKN